MQTHFQTGHNWSLTAGEVYGGIAAMKRWNIFYDAKNVLSLDKSWLDTVGCFGDCFLSAIVYSRLISRLAAWQENTFTASPTVASKVIAITPGGCQRRTLLFYLNSTYVFFRELSDSLIQEYYLCHEQQSHSLLLMPSWIRLNLSFLPKKDLRLFLLPAALAPNCLRKSIHLFERLYGKTSGFCCNRRNESGW